MYGISTIKLLGCRSFQLRPALFEKKLFHKSCIVQGFEEFSDVKKVNETFVTGRAWTAADLRRKVSCVY